jgi:hypothetical protein
MERFVFVAAVTIAIIFGVMAVFGGTNFHFSHGDHDGGAMSPVVETAPGRMEAQAFEGTRLRLVGAAANVTIIPEDRSDFLVEIDNPAGRTPMPSVASENGRVVIDGQLRRRISDCGADSVDLRGYGDVLLTDLPRITIRTPRALEFDRAGAGASEIGATENLHLDFSGCGDATIADVAGELNIDLSGSGHIQAGVARSVNIDIAGSGDIRVGAVAEGGSIDIAGSGQVTIASLNGDLSTDGAGTGDLSILGGAIGAADVDLAGSGGVRIVASVRSLNVDIVGSGDVDVDGEVGEIDADIAGSGSVTATRVTGDIRKEIWGSGDVRVRS